MSEKLEGVPQYYADFTGVQVGPYGALLDFRLRSPSQEGPGVPEPQAIVRLSVAHLWVLSKIADRTVKEFIEEAGPIPMPPELLKEMGLEEEYRQDMGSTDD